MRPLTGEYGPAISDVLLRAAWGPADCNADDPVSGRGCDLDAGHDGPHVSGQTTWED